MGIFKKISVVIYFTSKIIKISVKLAPFLDKYKKLQ